MGREKKKRIPWDIFVFLIITTVAFCLSVVKIINPDSKALAVGSETPQLFVGEKASRKPSSTETFIDIGCVKKGTHVEKMVTANGSIRVKGGLCHISSRRMKHLEGITVRNVTNGYEGTIFFQGTSNIFMTDFLVLQEGKNVIQVEWKEETDKESSFMTAEIYEPTVSYR